MLPWPVTMLVNSCFMNYSSFRLFYFFRWSDIFLVFWGLAKVYRCKNRRTMPSDIILFRQWFHSKSTIKNPALYQIKIELNLFCWVSKERFKRFELSSINKRQLEQLKKNPALYQIKIELNLFCWVSKERFKHFELSSINKRQLEQNFEDLTFTWWGNYFTGELILVHPI